MDTYQQFIAISRYARYLPEKKRRELWPETVDRYMEFMRKHLSTTCDYEIPADLYSEVRDAIVNLEVLPSMRALMTAGPALERENLAGFNPVADDTLVVTREYGNVPIKELEGKRAHVLNVDGRWAEATFKSYGIQPVYEVEFGYGNFKRTVEATANHRWVLTDGSVKSTSNLMVGDSIPTAFAPKEFELDLDYKLGVIHGLVYGDGTATYTQERVKGYHIRLCGDNAELLPYFEGYPVSYAPSAHGDPIVMLYGPFAKTHSLKVLPDPQKETMAYLQGFIRGWFAADGHLTAKLQASICADTTGKDWLIKWGDMLGWAVQRTAELPKQTNYGERKNTTYNVYFHHQCLSAEDFLRSKSRMRFEAKIIPELRVTAIRDLGVTKPVYCATVSDTNTFTLAHGIVTGNCSYVAVDDIRAFDEALYILMNGTGVGFSVERENINKLPEVAERFETSDTTIVVEDSKAGWAKALRELISLLYQGRIPKWDTSQVRPAGAILKTFGGRASGPAPLENLFQFCVDTFKKAAGRQLYPIEAHDIMCKIGEVVVVGGVRRSAMISLSNVSDDQLRDAKSGAWWENNPQRALANNSAVYKGRPTMDIFMREWMALYQSKSGERGIFNRKAGIDKIKEGGRRNPDYKFGTNPCGEILLRPAGLCNLSEVVVRGDDTEESLQRKVRLATIIGTWQSTLTKFKYVRSIWRRNAEEERLLGVSLTGIYDNPHLVFAPEYLAKLKELAIATNAEHANLLGINPSAAITCVKPSGTVSQLTNSASGIHPRFSRYYIRRVRGDKKDPLTKFLIDRGVPHEDCVMQPETTVVFSFPQAAPEGAVIRSSLSATDHFHDWLTVRREWCEHNPSITINVQEDEWMHLGAEVFSWFDQVCGVSFLPFSDHTYKQAPYEEIDEEQYKRMTAAMPLAINWEELGVYEENDRTISSQNFACTGDVCEIVDIKGA